MDFIVPSSLAFGTQFMFEAPNEQSTMTVVVVVLEVVEGCEEGQESLYSNLFIMADVHQKPPRRLKSSHWLGGAYKRHFVSSVSHSARSFCSGQF